ncbi:unnamed protein product [Moneuplotes crassus]|uniref:Uncharacterized protein n=1 Tax=Euplotes crassus TaxID=5936 RepID=A0AAD2D300_EUPCR|nr:unnamed protein product [Moneuplotes crassus]
MGYLIKLSSNLCSWRGVLVVLNLIFSEFLTGSLTSLDLQHSSTRESRLDCCITFSTRASMLSASYDCSDESRVSILSSASSSWLATTEVHSCLDTLSIDSLPKGIEHSLTSLFRSVERSFRDCFWSKKLFSMKKISSLNGFSLHRVLNGPSL